MAVSGNYMARRVRDSALEHITAFGECLLQNVMPAFDNIDRGAKEVADAEYTRLGSRPAYDDCGFDMADAAEAAQGKGLAFYQTMTGLRQGVLNVFAAGLSHLIEQELADLCHDASFQVEPINNAKPAEITEWFRRHLGLNLKGLPFWPTIEGLHLVANVVKHAEGDSAKRLRRRFPELFEDSVIRRLLPNQPNPIIRPLRLPLGGEDLYITEGQFRQYSEAAKRFFAGIASYFEAHGNESYPYG